MTQVELPLDEIKREWINDAIGTMTACFRIGEFSSDDIYTRIHAPPVPNWVGCAVAQAKNSGLIEYVRHQRSNRPSANGRKVSVWRVK